MSDATASAATGTRTAPARTTSARTTLIIALTAVFVTSLVTAQLISSKLAVFALPIIGAVQYPTGTFAYAGTFFATDVTGEVLGKDAARRLVNVGFLMNFLMLAFAWLAILAPPGQGGVAQSSFASVVGASTNIVFGSLLAYVVSQNWDVVAFHRLRELTDGDRLWLRNVGSTATSQFVDTVIFTVVAFAVAPAVLGVGFQLTTGELVATVVGQYVLKLAIALADTPLVYAAVGAIRRRTDIGAAPEPA